MTDTDPEQAFIAELDSEIRWEWHWEKFNRRFYVATNWMIWGARFLLLALAAYQINIGKDALSQSWIIFSIATLAMLNVALPLLSFTHKFQQRQEVHDRNAREYCVIKTELLAGTILLNAAVERFKEIRRQPTEATIRRTP
jgi:hypothetical protein